MVEQKLSEVDGAIRRLGTFTENMTDENQLLLPLVDEATSHADTLDERALFLDKSVLPQ